MWISPLGKIQNVITHTGKAGLNFDTNVKNMHIFHTYYTNIKSHIKIFILCFELCWGFFIFTTKTEEWDARHVGAGPVWECKSGEGGGRGGDKKLEKISTF